MSETTEWEEVREAFLELVEQPEPERDRRLAELRESRPDFARRVASLLEHDNGDREERDPAPTRFGPYEVVRRIGRGGMGEVFVARRADGEYEREVAVKLLLPGHADEELVRRFLRERQMLARLDHEYVAKLLDGGTTETGAPYLVMEYVEGERADEYAARQPLGERLRLFVRIGEAVTHAHEHGFVHRDLKPSNVLVRADGAPRLLDFGIARVEENAPRPRDGSSRHEEPLTRTGRRLFTPEYASPEQVRGEVATPSSDVFSLGVMLYVFLCGESPWPAGLPLHRLERAICELEPSPPSRRGTTRGRAIIAADLDAITLCCLAKEPRDRYPSVAELCADVERYLDGLPVRARRTGFFTRGIRLARRRPAVPAILALLGIAVATAAVAAVLHQREQRRRPELFAAAEERINVAYAKRIEWKLDEADAALDAAQAVLDDLPPSPELMVRILAQRAVQADLRGEHERALGLVERVEREFADVAPKGSFIRQQILNTRADACVAARPDEASDAIRRALDHALEARSPGDALRAAARVTWAEELDRQGRRDEALQQLAAAEDEVRAHDPRCKALYWILHARAGILAAEKRYAEAVDEFEEALRYLGWHHGAGHRSYATLHANLGIALFRLTRYDESRQALERAVETAGAIGREDLLAMSRLFLATILGIQGDLEGSVAAAREAEEIFQRLGDHKFHVRSRCQLGITLLRRGEGEEGERLVAEAISPENHAELADDMAFEAHRFLGIWLLNEGRKEEAAVHLREAYERGRAHFGDDHSIVRGLKARLDRVE